MALQQVILTSVIPNLGAEGDIVKVRAGYARNYLVLRALAYEATPQAKRKLDDLKKKRAEREAKELNEAQEMAARVNKITLTMPLETGATGKAFGSISIRDIEDRLAKDFEGLKIEKHMLSLEKPIKETGEHKIEVRLHPEVIAHITVVAQPAAKTEEAKPADTDEDDGGKKKWPKKKY